MTIEDQLMDDVRNGKQVDLERALLIASGCDTEEKVSEYKAKLDRIENGFLVYANARFIPMDDSRRMAEALHDYFWQTKPNRAKAGKFRLDEAIDAQLSYWKRKVGNCLANTALYTIIALRNGLDVSVKVNPGHIQPVVTDGKDKVSIETTNKNGFGMEKERGMEERGLYGLLSGICTGRASAARNCRNYEDAIRYCRMALEIDPDNATAYNTLGLVHKNMKRPDYAYQCFSLALEKCPDNAVMLNSRGFASGMQKKFSSAIDDFTAAIRADPSYAEAYSHRALARDAIGDTIGAEEDFAMCKKLEASQ